MRFSAILVAALLAGCGNGDSPADGSPADMLAPHDLVPQQDAAPPVCDVFAQTGCAAGEHCTVGKVNGKSQNLCWPNTSTPIAEGQACLQISPDGVTQGDQCAAGFACVNEIGDLRCRKLCVKHADCKPNQACVAATGSNQQGMNFGIAVAVAACVDDVGCDPILQTGCPTATRCLITRSDFEGRVTVCGQNVNGQGAPGADCTSSLDCAAGVRCSGLGFCRQLCYAMGMGNPPPGQGGCAASLMCSPIGGTGGIYGECD